MSAVLFPDLCLQEQGQSAGAGVGFLWELLAFPTLLCSTEDRLTGLRVVALCPREDVLSFVSLFYKIKLTANVQGGDLETFSFGDFSSRSV